MSLSNRAGLLTPGKDHANAAGYSYTHYAGNAWLMIFFLPVCIVKNVNFMCYNIAIMETRQQKYAELL